MDQEKNYQTEYHKKYYKQRRCLHVRLYQETCELLRDFLDKNNVSFQEFVQECCFLAINQDMRIVGILESIQNKKNEKQQNRLVYKNDDGTFEMEYDPSAIYDAIAQTIQNGEMPNQVMAVKKIVKKRGTITRENKEVLAKDVVELYKTGKYSVKELSKKFFTSYGNIWNILNENNLTNKKKKQFKTSDISLEGNDV